MSRENVEIVRRTFEAYERGDIAAMLADAHLDLITHRATMPMADTYHGHEGFLQAFIDWIEDFEEFSVTAEEFIDASDTQVLVYVRERALGSGSNVPVEIDRWFVYTLDGGKVVRLDMYVDEAQALEAVGLSEQDAHWRTSSS